jgi:hypothetical protein
VAFCSEEVCGCGFCDCKRRIYWKKEASSMTRRRKIQVHSMEEMSAENGNQPLLKKTELFDLTREFLFHNSNILLS